MTESVSSELLARLLHSLRMSRNRNAGGNGLLAGPKVSSTRQSVSQVTESFVGRRAEPFGRRP